MEEVWTVRSEPKGAEESKRGSETAGGESDGRGGGDGVSDGDWGNDGGGEGGGDGHCQATNRPGMLPARTWRLAPRQLLGHADVDAHDAARRLVHHVGRGVELRREVGRVRHSLGEVLGLLLVLVQIVLCSLA